MSDLQDALEEVQRVSRFQRKRLQKEALSGLRERGLSDLDIGAHLGIDTRQIQRWDEGVLARPSMLANLLLLSRRKRLPPIEKREPSKRGRVAVEDIARLQAKMKKHKLWPPSVRVRTLTSLRRATNLSMEAFAGRIGIVKTQLYKYIKSSYKGMMTEEVLDRIIALQRAIERHAAPVTPEEEFTKYLRKLFGSHYDEKTLVANPLLLGRALTELSRRTALTVRVLKNNLPPARKNKAPRREIVRAIKLAANQGPLLP